MNHNLLSAVQHFSTALSMRMVLQSQLMVFHESAAHAQEIDHGLAATSRQRAETYMLLVRATRDVRGLLGNAGAAAAHAATVAARAQRLDPPATGHPAANGPALHQLDRLFTRIDARLAAVVEHGVSQRLYLRRVKLPRLSEQSEGMGHRAHTRYTPIDSRVQDTLIPIARSRLRPIPEATGTPDDASRTRSAFEAARSASRHALSLTLDPPKGTQPS